jgi:hypothetical protein
LPGRFGEPLSKAWKISRVEGYFDLFSIQRVPAGKSKGFQSKKYFWDKLRTKIIAGTVLPNVDEFSPLFYFKFLFK